MLAKNQSPPPDISGYCAPQTKRRRRWFIMIFAVVALDVLIVSAAGDYLARSPIVKTVCDAVAR